MKINWNQLIINLTIWAIAEVTLNFVGLDTIADYSEFLGNKHQVVNTAWAIAIQ